jgi:hypothetical protein
MDIEMNEEKKEIRDVLAQLAVRNYYKTLCDTFSDDTFANDTLDDFEGESQCTNASD